MKLYHYTAATLAKGILSEGLTIGHLEDPQGKIIHGVVWFTSLPFPEGTGVPTGKHTLTESQAHKAKRVQGVLRNKFTFDKTRVRLTYDSQDLPSYQVVDGQIRGLISFEKWCKLVNAPKRWAKHIGLSAFHDLNSLSDEELFRLHKKKGNSKESTWYLYFGKVSPDVVQAVDYKVGREYVTYDFDAHGRVEMALAGVECVGPIAHNDLAGIIKPLHRHETVHASIMCDEPLEKSIVCVRGGGNTCFIEFEEKSFISLRTDDPAYPVSDIYQWIDRNIDELRRCKERALETYYKFYPEKKCAS
ncbi:hypothetical protein E6B08_23345 [Pseudomonas putida]|uniref:Uncharacterized protein n=1 Tax=Pseudomonas putida TaxID=303 RepID=A0A4D6XI39_PSEPU|nr:hypothetical protein [Pseudomonas putida]QCI14098.1 hypothetical protein E6B08_23345 [Pseudomonas putida]